MEIKEIVDFEGYFVTEDGRVFKELNPFTNKSPSPRVNLRRDGKTIGKNVAELVLTTWKYKSKYQATDRISYNDCDLSNVHVNNLTWRYDNELNEKEE